MALPRAIRSCFLTTLLLPVLALSLGHATADDSDPPIDYFGIAFGSFIALPQIQTFHFSSPDHSLSGRIRLKVSSTSTTGKITYSKITHSAGYKDQKFSGATILAINVPASFSRCFVRFRLPSGAVFNGTFTRVGTINHLGQYSYQSVLEGYFSRPDVLLSKKHRVRLKESRAMYISIG